MPQSLSNVLVHIVFSTKDCHPYLIPDLRTNLFPYFGGVARDVGCTLLQTGGVEDHVHLLLALSRTITIAKLVEELKTSTSKWMKKQGDVFRPFSWQAGYAAFSVSPSDKENVRQYLLSQEEHHKKSNFQEELRALLKDAGVEYDEKYLWD